MKIIHCDIQNVLQWFMKYGINQRMLGIQGNAMQTIILWNM